MLHSLVRPLRPFLSTSRLITQHKHTFATFIVKCPPIAESINEADVGELTTQVGDWVAMDGGVCTLETDKVDVTVPSKEAGYLRKWLVKSGDKVIVEQPMAEVETGLEPPASQPKSEPAKAPEASQKSQLTESAPAPTASVASPKQSTPSPASAPKTTPPPAASSSQSAFTREVRKVKMNRMRLKIAENLKNSQNTAASLTTFNEIDMTNIIALRSQYKDAILEKHGIKFGFMSPFVKACTIALKEIPAVNASIEESGDDKYIVYHEYADVSVAVATPKGLVTPVVRNCESQSMVEIERSIAAIGAKAKDGKLTVGDMSGGTFTVSNGGVFGSLMGTPIINSPQCAILGMHATKDRAVAVNGKLEVRPMMYIALTYDHRVIDGREAVTFLKMVKELIEDPRRMLLDI